MAWRIEKKSAHGIAGTAAGWLAAALVLALSGCGDHSPSSAAGGAPSAGTDGGSGSGSAPDTLPGNADVTLPAISAAFAQLPHSSPEADATAMLAAAQGLAGVQSASMINPTTVAVLFADGTPLVIDLRPLNDDSNKLDPASGASSIKKAPLRARDALLPGARSAYLYDAAPVDFRPLGLQGTPSAQMAPWFQAAGYTPVQAAGTLDDVMNVKNASVLYLNAHGVNAATSPHYVSDTKGSQVFAIQTSLPATDGIISQLLPQFQKGEVGYYAWAGYHIDEATGRPAWYIFDNIFITPQFVRDYMSFAPNSVLFMNVCSLMSDDAAAQDMVQAFFDVGAGAILGWDNVVGALDGNDAGLFFFDRVLGAGATGGYLPYTTTPANRPFSVGAVFREMQERSHVFTTDYYAALGITTPKLDISISPEWGFEGSGLQALTTPEPVTATLMLKYSDGNLASNKTIALVPTISTLALQNDKGLLTLTGDFGDGSQNHELTVGGTPVSATWGSGMVTATLPMSGGGSGGYVQVTVDGAASNKVMLNQWNGVPLTMTTYNGPSTRTVTCSVNLRASLDSLRATIDQGNAVASTTDNVVLQNGQCSFVATGPSASGSLPWFDSSSGGPLPSTAANVNGTVLLDNRGGGTMQLSIQAAYADSTFGFLDSSATNNGNVLEFDDTSEALATGIASQTGGGQLLDTFQWSATAAAFTPVPYSQHPLVVR